MSSAYSWNDYDSLGSNGEGGGGVSPRDELSHSVFGDTSDEYYDRFGIADNVVQTGHEYIRRSSGDEGLVVLGVDLKHLMEGPTSVTHDYTNSLMQPPLYTSHMEASRTLIQQQKGELGLFTTEYPGYSSLNVKYEDPAMSGYEYMSPYVTNQQQSRDMGGGGEDDCAVDYDDEMVEKSMTDIYASCLIRFAEAQRSTPTQAVQAEYNYTNDTDYGISSCDISYSNSLVGYGSGGEYGSDVSVTPTAQPPAVVPGGGGSSLYELVAMHSTAGGIDHDGYYRRTRHLDPADHDRLPSQFGGSRGLDPNKCVYNSSNSSGTGVGGDMCHQEGPLRSRFLSRSTSASVNVQRIDDRIHFCTHSGCTKVITYVHSVATFLNSCI